MASHNTGNKKIVTQPILKHYCISMNVRKEQVYEVWKTALLILLFLSLANAESGRLVLDYTNNRLYVCNALGTSRNWDYIALTD